MTTITIDRAVVEQALEAIEALEYLSNLEERIFGKICDKLRAALAEQPAEQEVDWEKLYRLEVKKKEALVAKYERDTGKQLTRIVPLAEQPAQPQEPVAYVCPSSHVTADGSMEDGSDYLEWADEASDYEKRVGTPLYTAPQPAKPAERVPLTDEEIKYATLEAANHLIDHIYEYGVNSEGVSHRIYKFARAIEAKILEQFK